MINATQFIHDVLSSTWTEALTVKDEAEIATRIVIASALMIGCDFLFFGVIRRSTFYVTVYVMRWVNSRRYPLTVKEPVPLEKLTAEHLLTSVGFYTIIKNGNGETVGIVDGSTWAKTALDNQKMLITSTNGKIEGECAMHNSETMRSSKFANHNLVLINKDTNVVIGNGFRLGTYIVTNKHVIESLPHEEFLISGIGGTIKFNADEACLSSRHDFAYFKVSNRNLSILGIKDNKRFTRVSSNGLVTVASRTQAGNVVAKGMAVSYKGSAIIEHTASTNPGMSGSPVYDKNGTLVGIHVGTDYKSNFMLDIKIVITILFSMEGIKPQSRNSIITESKERNSILNDHDEEMENLLAKMCWDTENQIDFSPFLIDKRELKEAYEDYRFQVENNGARACAQELYEMYDDAYCTYLAYSERDSYDRNDRFVTESCETRAGDVCLDNIKACPIEEEVVRPTLPEVSRHQDFRLGSLVSCKQVTLPTISESVSTPSGNSPVSLKLMSTGAEKQLKVLDMSQTSTEDASITTKKTEYQSKTGSKSSRRRSRRKLLAKSTNMPTLPVA
jgi:S1-C subfamily serine protease